jgi:hypothetical protein
LIKKTKEDGSIEDSNHISVCGQRIIASCRAFRGQDLTRALKMDPLPEIPPPDLFQAQQDSIYCQACHSPTRRLRVDTASSRSRTSVTRSVNCMLDWMLMLLLLGTGSGNC